MCAVAILLILIVVIVCLCICSASICSASKATEAYFTSRIGNLVDAWYFGSLGSRERQKEFKLIQRQCSSKSFGKYLKLDSSLQQHIDPSTLPRIVAAADTFWTSYDYDVLSLCIEQYSRALQAQMNEYATKCRPELLCCAPYDCVVHFRIGDFLKIGQVIDPQSVVDACAALRPSSICIMDGGMSHETDDATREASLQVKERLKGSLEALPNRPHVEYHDARDTDSDFYTCASSPILVTAGGSFAICAAVANTGIVRTPACKNTNFCNAGAIATTEIRPGWTTFAYKNYSSE